VAQGAGKGRRCCGVLLALDFFFPLWGVELTWACPPPRSRSKQSQAAAAAGQIRLAPLYGRSAGKALRGSPPATGCLSPSKTSATVGGISNSRATMTGCCHGRGADRQLKTTLSATDEIRFGDNEPARSPNCRDRAADRSDPAFGRGWLLFGQPQTTTPTPSAMMSSAQLPQKIESAGR